MWGKLAAGVAGLVLVPALADAALAEKCTAAKLKAIAHEELGLLRCSAKEATKAGIAPACEIAVGAQFAAAYNKQTGCPPAPEASVTAGIADRCQRYVRTALPDGSGATPSKCEQARLKAAAKLTSGELRCYAKAAAKGLPVDLAGCITKVQGDFAAAFGKVSGCTGDGNQDGIRSAIDLQCVTAQATTDSAGFVTSLGSEYPPNFQLLNTDPTWSKTWTHIVSGRFSASPYSGLFFYDQSTGFGAFYYTDGQGHIVPMPLSNPRTPIGGRPWTHVIPGFFGPSGYTGLLFYDQTSGVAQFYDTDGQGNLTDGHGNLDTPLREYFDWRNTWTQIVSGMFAPPGNGGQSYSSLFFYSPSEGDAEIWSTDGTGAITRVWSDSNLRATWTNILAGEFSSAGNPFYSDLFFYEGSTGYGEMYRVGLRCVGGPYDSKPCSGDGECCDQASCGTCNSSFGLVPYPRAALTVGQCAGGPFRGTSCTTNADCGGACTGFTNVVAGNFGGDGRADLLFHDRTTGHVKIWKLGGEDAYYFSQPIQLDDIPAQASGIGSGVDLVVPGNFWLADTEDHWFQDGPGAADQVETRNRRISSGAFTDLLLYDRNAGSGSFYMHEPLPPPDDDLAGYVSAASCRGSRRCLLGLDPPYSSGSVRPGESIEFHVSSRIGPYTIKIYPAISVGIDPPLAEVTGLPKNPTAMPVGRTAYRDGAQWPAVAPPFQVPSWASGLYIARVEASGQRVDLPFVVRAPTPGAQSNILLVLADATYNAYNYWGGRSVYGYLHGNGPGDPDGPSRPLFASPQTGNYIPYAFHVAFDRPYAGLQGPQWQNWELPFFNWLAARGITVEVETARDLAVDPPDPQQHRLLVFVGHGEYWSREMRLNVESFASQGGNVAFFGGNTSWWQVRFSADGQTMTCYKNRWFDPDGYIVSNWPLVTTNWFADPVDEPETSLTGMSYGYVSCGQPACSACSPSTCPTCACPDCSIVGPYYGSPLQFTTVLPTHWVFAGTGLSYLGQFGTYGNGASIVQGGTETDHAQSNCMMQSPATFTRLASLCPLDATCNQGAVDGAFETGTVGIFTPNGGTSWVFTAGTTDWTMGLSQVSGTSNPMDQITLNVLTCGAGTADPASCCSDDGTACSNAQQICGFATNNCGSQVSCGRCPLTRPRCCLDACVCTNCPCP